VIDAATWHSYTELLDGQTALKPIDICAPRFRAPFLRSFVTISNSPGCVSARLSGRRTGSSVLGPSVIAFGFNGIAQIDAQRFTIAPYNGDAPGAVHVDRMAPRRAA
jgi:hypothetical protein